MTQKRLWIVIGLFAVALAGYWGYQRLRAPARSPWELMPSDALVVLESTALQDTLPADKLLSEMSLQTTPLFREALQSLNQLIWSPLDTASALRLVRQKPVWYSLHPTSRHRLDFIFYLPLRNSTERAQVDRLLTPDAARFRVLRHPYQNERIYELLTVGNESLGSFVLLDDYLIGSPSTLLIEAVIRRMRQPFTETPLQRADVQLLRPGTIGGLYVRSTVLSALFPAAGEATQDWQSQYIRSFLPVEIKTVFRPSVDRQHLIGTSTDDISTQTGIAALFEEQTPIRIGCGHLIPSQTATLFHIGLSDGTRFGNALTPFINSENDIVLRDGRRRLRPLLRNDEVSVYRYLGNELVLCRLDAPTVNRRLVMLVKATNPEKLFDRLQLASILTTRSGQVGRARRFLRYSVTRLDGAELPAYLFGGLFRGFTRSWVAQSGSYLIIANGEDVMEEYLQTLEDKAVWSENRRMQVLMSQTMRPANFSVYTRFSRAGAAMASQWPPSWQRLLAHDESALENIDNLIFQSSYGRERIYSTLVLGRANRRASDAVVNRVFLQKRIELNAPPLSAPMPLGDFMGGTGHVWVVDNARQLVQLSPEGEKKIAGAIDGPIRSRLVAVNFLNNERFQFAFTTDRTLYIADPDPASGKIGLRSVRLPEGLRPEQILAPRERQGQPTALLLAHRDGSVYGYDRAGQRFVRQYAVSAPGEGLIPFQTLLRNQSLTVASLQQEGRLNLWYENGTRATGFPVDLKTNFIGPAFLSAGSPATLTTISQQGELIRVGEDGQVLERTQQYRPIRRGSFRLLPDETGSDFVLLRSTDTEVAVLDKTGNRLFEVRGLLPGRTTVRYHVLESDLKLISVKSGDFTTLYQLNGRPVGDRPIPGPQPVELQFSPGRNKLFVYGSTEKTVQIWSIKLQ